jgi:uncharacterized protein
MLDATALIWLTSVAGIAGVIDAIAGGGGLLTLPALLMAGIPPHQALATNKGQSVWGSSAALLRFYHSSLLDRKRMPLAFLLGAVGAALGATTVQAISATALRPMVLVLLIIAALVILFIRTPQPGEPRPRSILLNCTVAGAIGAYDGFFGPGTGTFLILAYVVLWREPFDVASANAKVVNCASNAGSLLIFSILGQVLWLPAICMGAAQLCGGWIGAHLVLRGGQRLVRTMAVIISLAVIAKLVWQMTQTTS